ncbi:MAG: TMEM175 family protein [Alphaproteobacteria bacterium]
MSKSRLEAFSDGVIAIIITIMVLEMKVPHGADFAALAPLWPVFLGYILSFLYVGIYWNNHHHMLHAAHHVTGTVLWANLHLLFWLSLIPFSTGWMGENHFAPLPSALYGCNLLMAAAAYWILQTTIICAERDTSILARAVGKNIKEKMSLVLYLSGIVSAFYFDWTAQISYLVVALMWIIPDARIEQALEKKRSKV